MSAISIRMVPGDKAPHYPDAVECEALEAVITEQGTEANLPIVDLVAEHPSGQRVVIVLTGSILLGIAAAVRGANLRNHGVAEPGSIRVEASSDKPGDPAS